MEINDIHIYLRNPVDYSIGVAIYNHFGSSQVLKDNFSKFNNSFWREKLLAEIKKLATDHPEVKKIPEQKKPAVKKTVEFVQGHSTNKREFIDLTTLPGELLEKFKKNGDNARTAEYLKRLLINSPQNKRLQIVAEIAALHDENISNWNDIDYYQEHKKLKEKTAKTDKRLMQKIEPHKKHNQLQSWMSQRSKLKKKKDAASLDKIKDLTIKIDLLRKELQ